MSVVINFPPNAATFIPTRNIFQATFGTPTLGVYDFGTKDLPVAGNTNQTVLKTKYGFQYIISGISVSANISSADYLGSQAYDVSSSEYLPVLNLTTKKGGRRIHSTDIPLSRLVENMEMMLVFNSQIDGDELQASITGRLNQIQNTVGVSPLVLLVSLSVYEVQEYEYNRQFLKGVKS